MTTSTAMGLPGVRLTPGAHICAFFRGPNERDEVLVPFLREALLAGDKCMCVTDDPDAERVGAPLAEDVEPAALARAAADDVLGRDLPRRRLLRGRAMLDFWERTVGGAVEREGFGVVRAVGEMTWASAGKPGVERLVTYESRLNLFLPRYPNVIAVPLRPRTVLRRAVLLELLRTHPKVLLVRRAARQPLVHRAATSTSRYDLDDPRGRPSTAGSDTARAAAGGTRP